MEENENVIDIEMNLGQIYDIMKLFEEIDFGSQISTKKIYDYVIYPDYLYIETVNHTIYRIKCQRCFNKG